MGRKLTSSLTQEDKDYVRDNWESTRVADMAKHLRKSTRSVYRYMGEMGWRSLGGANKATSYKRKNIEVEEGFFNVDLRELWV